MRARRALTAFTALSLGVLAATGARSLWSRTPEVPDVLASMKVPKGFTVERVAGADLVAYPMFGSLDERGRLFLFESIGHVYPKTEEAHRNPQFRVNLLEDLNGDGTYDKSTIFADKLTFPQGGVFHDGSLIVTAAPDLLRLTDTNGDGVADKKEVLLTGFTLNVNANSLIGPFMSPDGRIYMTSAIEGFDVTTREGVRMKGTTARIWRARPDGRNLEWISAGGMNNPVELTFTDAGEPIGTETYYTDPAAGIRDALVYWTEGGMYPKQNRNIARDSLPRTGDLLPAVSLFSRVAPAGVDRYRSGVWGAEYKGNLFSALFNPHRVLRHKLVRDGGNFKTVDEVFLSNDHIDFHPTDIFEDADGSLLVIDTGGWFVQGCPLSQVSKPDARAGIYRIRKTGSPQVKDPYGNRIDFSRMRPEGLAALLADPRPKVRDRAGNKLVELGNGSVRALSGVLGSSKNVEARTAAAFALGRIETPVAQAAARAALNDANSDVRIAAARMAGLNRDRGSVDQLISLTRSEHPAVRRQAATALGQVGDARAAGALLEAAARPADRMVEHANIFALMQLGDPAPLLRAVEGGKPSVRRAALIALDQMRPSPLEASHVTAFLGSNDAAIRKTGLWVATHHPEWAGALVGLVRQRLQGPALSADESASMGEIVSSLCADSQVQSFVGDELSRPGSGARTLFFLDAVGRCELKELPASWSQALGTQLRSTDPLVLARTIDLIQLRRRQEPAGLEALIANQSLPTELRVSALAALAGTRPQLSQAHFSFLYDQLRSGNQARIRQQAAGVLGSVELSDAQLERLATEYLPTADAFILPRLVPVFERGARSPQIGSALIAALMKSASLDSFSEERLQAVFKKYPASVQTEARPLMARLSSLLSQRRERLDAMEASVGKGDIDRGRAVFFGKASCSSCHSVGAKGGTFGPDLTSLGRDRSRHDVLESIVFPSASFVREYETYKISARTAEYMGMVKQQNPQAIVVATGPGTTVRIPREEVTRMEVVPVSMMPPGLDQLLSRQELADLLAFIIGQDQDPSRAADRDLMRSPQ